jgi:hypothetical protein
MGAVEFDPDAITNVDGGCARAATFGEGKVGAVEIGDDRVEAEVLPVVHSATLEIG